MSTSDMVAVLYGVLKQIAEHTGADSNGLVDEWTEAAAFSDVQELARETIRKVDNGEIK